MLFTRREAVRNLALFGGVFLVSRSLTACSGNEGGALGVRDDALETCGPSVIERNHGHEIVVSGEDVAAKVTKTYSIRGKAGHDHTVTITAADFAVLEESGVLTVVSSETGGHAHVVTVKCTNPPPVSCEGGKISQNHGHVIVVSSADLAAGVAKTYSIQGTSNHDHEVTITADQFAELSAGGEVTVLSTEGYWHQHTVTILCEVPVRCAEDITGSIEANHGHSLAVPAVDVAVGVTKTYSIRGASSHDHVVTVTTEDFAALAAGKSLVLSSTSTFGHTHEVTVTCGTHDFLAGMRRAR